MKYPTKQVPGALGNPLAKEAAAQRQANVVNMPLNSELKTHSAATSRIANALLARLNARK